MPDRRDVVLRLYDYELDNIFRHLSTPLAFSNEEFNAWKMLIALNVEGGGLDKFQDNGGWKKPAWKELE